ncbi:2-dehydropantoate 2-reductase [Paenibacillus sp. yr247]|uniref:ketopantoate reductase family protein n=1 Tax=Paenibacillus sp. yr247 TaxID=1761880 RepID=UPI00088BC070|nr:ketopantoate reductase family protein [Paenibacillus sp. yr247]SDO74267.1 2-dehydropantoate 2-reductase [Paenibacillus sp. yr247]
MKITVIGAGAVGGYFGARMMEAAIDVTFLVREKRAEQLQKTGLRIHSNFGETHLQNLQLATHPDDIKACDLVIVAVKNYQLPNAIDSIRPLVAKGAKVLPLLNGIEHYAVLKEALGVDAVMGGMCQIIATLNESGEIVQTGPVHDLFVGPLELGQENLGKLLREACAGANMSVTYREDILAQIWQKYAFITSFSGVTTASRLPIGELLACDAAKRVFHNALSEMSALAESKEVTLPKGFADYILAMMNKLPKESTSSMHQDLIKGLPLEVESLQGGALRMAAQSEINLPTISTIYGLIKPFEHGSIL